MNQSAPERPPNNPALKFGQIEGREWWLWAFAVIVTIVLTAGIISLTFFTDQNGGTSSFWGDLREWVRGLAALVLMFDIYTVYQHHQLQRIRRQLAERDKLFQIISENAADMIAVVDSQGRRLYNSPSYQKVLGYSNEELSGSTGLEQIHPEDRERVAQAAEKARRTGRGQRLEYRMRHKDSTWRILESSASPVQDEKGALENLVIVNRDITERKRAEDMLAHSALHDGLTGLPNRALFLDRVQHALLRARRHRDSRFAVLFVDIDEFKVVNDSLGHPAGDELLVQIAKRMIASFREADSITRSSPPDTFARFGGDEFTVLLEDMSKASDAIRVAQRIQEGLLLPFDLRGHHIVIAVSIGVALSGASYERPEDLLRDAEIAMYRAKRTGKARVEVFDPAMHSSALRRLKMEADLRRGIESGELLVYYQPIVSLKTGKITGFEALSRWKKPEGMISPAEFIPIADESGLILAMNHQLLVDACGQLKSWQSQFRCEPPLTMSVNIAPKQFSQAGLADEIRTIIRETGIAPGVINLEIMETIAMGDADRAQEILSELKGLGVRLSIDDFGTGYSSLSRLPRFPVDALKIDRIFISEMSRDHDSHEIVRLILMLAHSVGLKVVAEGTETQDQIDELRNLGCDMAQGFLFSPPVEADAAYDLLLRSRESALVQ